MYERKLTQEQALEIMASREKGVFLASKYGVSESMISRIRNQNRRMGDLVGRPSKIRGSTSSHLETFDDRLDRAHFQSLGRCAIAFRRVEKGLKVIVTNNPWQDERNFQVRWAVDKAIAHRIKRQFMQDIADLAVEPGVFAISDEDAFLQLTRTENKIGAPSMRHKDMMQFVRESRQRDMKRTFLRLGMGIA